MSVNFILLTTDANLSLLVNSHKFSDRTNKYKKLVAEIALYSVCLSTNTVRFRGMTLQSPFITYDIFGFWVSTIKSHLNSHFSLFWILFFLPIITHFVRSTECTQTSWRPFTFICWHSYNQIQHSKLIWNGRIYVNSNLVCLTLGCLKYIILCSFIVLLKLPLINFIRLIVHSDSFKI